jgi:hypothetical protein
MFDKQKLKKTAFFLISKALILDTVQMFAWQQQKNGAWYHNNYDALTLAMLGSFYA